jgi:N-acetyl sugar amidotransferase
MNVYNEEELKKDPEANFDRPYQQCAISVMDTIADPDITFDEKGICNYYNEYKNSEKELVHKAEQGQSKLLKDIEKIKKSKGGKKYDCILGLSGGVDSTFLCLLAKEHGLKPLVVHFDNGWNSELAQLNIENTVTKCGFDLYTYVVDWSEFKEMQKAYLRASVVDIEVLTDHAFMAVLFAQARKWKIKFVLAGMNVVTEQVLPKNWIYDKGDTENIKDIVNKFGELNIKKIKSYPFLSYLTKRYCKNILKMEVLTPLNYIEYNYDHVKKRIIEELDWRDYGGKHYESIWTRFYQGYILPNKFNIDKRKAHLSNLIFSGQLSKENAQEILKSPPIPSSLLENDMEFVLKKLRMTSNEFNEIISMQRREHFDFETEKGFRHKIKRSLKFKKR